MSAEKIVYAERPTGPLSVHVLRPSGDVDRTTAVLHLHGGGWRMGMPELLTPRSAALAALGYTVVQVQYRLLSDDVQWPAPVVDLRSALRWVHQHADELGVRRDRIVLWGHSAGAHISLMTAGTRNEADLDDPGDDNAVPLSVAAVIACYPPVQPTSAATVRYRHSTCWGSRAPTRTRCTSARCNGSPRTFRRP